MVVVFEDDRIWLWRFHLHARVESRRPQRVLTVDWNEYVCRTIGIFEVVFSTSGAVTMTSFLAVLFELHVSISRVKIVTLCGCI